jgi:hypothetical protein
MIDNLENKIKNYTITEDHFGIFDNFFDESLLNSYIEYFEKMESVGLTHDRGVNFKPHECQDKSCSIFADEFIPNHSKEFSIIYIINPFINVFKECYNKYVEKYSVLSGNTIGIVDAKIQKTSPGQGFHVWHHEHGPAQLRNRVSAFSLYLNDVSVGGETEFLHQKKRFDVVSNRLLIWPAGYTHTHRGNPPLSNDKYIITGWVEYLP